MSIQFTCPCGRTLRAQDQHAGLKVKCPACGATTAVPKPEPGPEAELAFLDEEPASATQPAPPPATVDQSSAIKRRRKKKARERSSIDHDDSLAGQYLARARAEMKRDEILAASAGGTDESGGWTMFGIHVTAGVLAGTGMVFIGILGFIALAVFHKDFSGVLNVRVLAGAGACTAIGAFTLIRSLVYGQED
jgi:hypothetical protein